MAVVQNAIKDSSVIFKCLEKSNFKKKESPAVAAAKDSVTFNKSGLK